MSEIRNAPMFRVSGTNGKEVFIDYAGAGDLRELVITVDCDDVDHYATAFNLRKMLAILNAHWNDPAYAALTPRPQPAIIDGDADDPDADDAIWESRYEEGKQLLRELTAESEGTL